MKTTSFEYQLTFQPVGTEIDRSAMPGWQLIYYSLFPHSFAVTHTHVRGVDGAGHGERVALPEKLYMRIRWKRPLP